MSRQSFLGALRLKRDRELRFVSRRTQSWVPVVLEGGKGRVWRKNPDFLTPNPEEKSPDRSKVISAEPAENLQTNEKIEGAGAPELTREERRARRKARRERKARRAERKALEKTSKS